MASNDPSEYLREAKRHLHEADRHHLGARRLKSVLVAGRVVRGVWTFLMLLSLP